MVMVCYGIHRTSLLRPYIIDATANGEPYAAMLNEVLQPYTDDIPLATLRLFWFHCVTGLNAWKMDQFFRAIGMAP
jgi:hypothetical protein